VRSAELHCYGALVLAICFSLFLMPHERKAKQRILSAGQRVFERFYLKRPLGDGGMGVVWLARDRVLEQDVALKFLADHLLHDRLAVERLKHETRRNLKLSHPNIVRIHDFLQDANAAAIMMEYVEGWSLWSLKVDKPRQIFSLEEIKPWLRELCDALDYAHNKVGIVHRDVNPTNLMLSARGQVKITDFGMARTIRQTSTGKDFVDTRVVGTDLYMSPQQWSGEEPTVSDDIYSVGATIYELLTGKPPFYQGKILDQVFEKIPPKMNERLRELGVKDIEISESFENTIAACLAKTPEGRPVSVTELASRLGLGEKPTTETGTEILPKAEDAEPAPVEETPKPEQPAPPLVVLQRPRTEIPITIRAGALIGFACALIIGLAGWLLVAKLTNRTGSSLAARAPGTFPKTGKPWENSLGMKFVPVPGVAGLISIWETRVEDYAVYVDEMSHEPGTAMLSLDAAGAWKESGHTWRNPEFDQNTNHPVVGVSWNEAVSFCEWLTIRERAAGWITKEQSYRMPTLDEWVTAAGTNRFVWGKEWPPPKGAGNFAGEEIRQRLPSHPVIAGYNDGYSGTAPVGSFKPNAYGIYDLSGNVAEFCSIRDSNDQARRPWLVGGSWHDGGDTDLAVATSRSHIRPVRRVSDCGFRCILVFNSATNSVPARVDANE
jgi:serine/threonine protein kinase/formylglycine-generating enzyme required for sulfatase activity